MQRLICSKLKKKEHAMQNRKRHEKEAHAVSISATYATWNSADYLMQIIMHNNSGEAIIG